VDLSALFTLAEFRRLARERLPRAAYDYYRGAADARRTLRRNREAFADYEIWPRVLVDVAARRLETEVLGEGITCPVMIAPTAYQRMAHPEGECATARGAASAGTVMIASTLATRSLEEIAESAPEGKRWFQLYVHRDRGLTADLVRRAQAAGYRALVLTVDAPLLGRRLADVRNGFALPEGLTMANFAAAASARPAVAKDSALAHYVATRHDPSLTWRDLEWLRSLSPMPLVLKGILRADDARLAVEHGVDAIVVSNHGGRQLDGSPASIDALEGVIAAVGGRCEVYLDGGIRWGTDVLVALALGARAVLVGRPVLWGLAVGGDAGVRRVIEILRDELSTAMAIAGAPDVRAVDRSLVRRRNPRP
jgi:4-hydroxymandelate oxidase